MSRNASAAVAALVTVFGRLFAAGFPLERMRVTSPAEVAAAPTGDGNTTAASVCRAVRGSTVWTAPKDLLHFSSTGH